MRNDKFAAHLPEVISVGLGTVPTLRRLPRFRRADPSTAPDECLGALIRLLDHPLEGERHLLNLNYNIFGFSIQ
jgi:hypothetical protein